LSRRQTGDNYGVTILTRGLSLVVVIYVANVWFAPTERNYKIWDSVGLKNASARVLFILTRLSGYAQQNRADTVLTNV